MLGYRLRQWRSILRVLGVSLQASCLFPHSPKVLSSLKHVESCINTQVVCTSFLDVCSPQGQQNTQSTISDHNF